MSPETMAEDASFSNLSLNLIPDDALTNLQDKRKGKIQGDRRARVKQRKEAYTEKVSARNEKTLRGAGTKRKHDKEEDDKKHTQSTERDRRQRGDHESGAKKQKNNVVIASLFRKNPEVPVLANTEVEVLKENVFTGDAFKDLPLHPYLVSNLEEKQGFKQLTEVQKRTIPALLNGKDALVKSQTGSGKTLAYAVPVIQSIQARKLKVKREDGPYALVIVPTRELALQSFDLFQKLLRSFVWIVPGCLIGGEKKKAEKARLRKGINILVSTPGRLMDHINTTGVLSLARIRWLVIDEADRMLELGYERDVLQILNALKAQCPDPPQTVLLSATLSQGVERLSSITLHDPEHISVSDEASSSSTSTTDTPSSNNNSKPASVTYNQTETTRDKHIEQDSGVENFSLPSQLKQLVVVTPCKQRLITLAAFVLMKCKYSKPRCKMIVFLSTQDSVEFHAHLFNRVLGSKQTIQTKLSKIATGGDKNRDDEDDESDDGIDVNSSDDERGDKSSHRKGDYSKDDLKVFKLHGDMPQKDRSRTFHEFTQATSGVLLCTDVAARGLDLPYVQWIVQYTAPGATVDYVHRVGRTARAGSKGQALLFLMPSEAGYVEELNRRKISLKQFQPSTVLKCLLDNISDLPKPDGDTSKLLSPRTHEEAATYLQDRFEECVLHQDNMQAMAAKGFQSYVRGYATYSKEVKDIFRVSDLHLGHVAKSFALREAPEKLHGIAAKLGITAGRGGNKFKKGKEGKPSKRPLSFKQATLSEYSSGFQTSKKTMAKPGGQTKSKVKQKFKGKKTRT